MTMLMIEGFEQIAPSVDITALNMRDLFLGILPDEDYEWFQGTGDSIKHNTNGRIAGNCLRFTRGADVAPAFSAATNANLGFSFKPKQKIALGFAVNYSEAPLAAIPLAGFRYDAGQGNIEQLSLWATPDGKLYISATPYNSDAALISTLINPVAVTEAGTFRFTQWTYIELIANYADTIPKVSVLVNGSLVLDGIEDASLMQMADSAYISSAHIFNMANTFFDGHAYWQSVDDVYIDDALVHGPQWIVPLARFGASMTLSGWTDYPDDVYTGIGYVTGANWGDYAFWDLEDLPAGVGTITAIGVSVIAQQASMGIDAITFGVANGSNTGIRSKKASLSVGDPSRCLRYCTETPPTGLSMTAASLANMRGYIKSEEVVI